MIVKFEKYIRDTLEAKEFKSAFEYLFNIIEEKLNELKNNVYIKRANEIWIEAWEIFYGIGVDKSLTLEERRMRVLLVKLTKPPFTKNTIIQQIRGITGVDNEITEDELNLVLNVDLTGATKFIYKIVNEYIRKVKPENVVYVISTTPPDLQDNGTYYMATFVTKCIVVI